MKAMSSADFIKQIKSDPNGSYMFFGEEDYLKSHALRSLKEAMGIEPALELFNYVRLDVLDYTPEKLIDALSPPPMMAEKKLVVLSGINTTTMRSSELSDLYDALAHIEEFDYNNFVLLLPSGCIDDSYRANRETSPISVLSKLLTPVNFEQSTPQRLAAWSMKHFSHYKISASADDCAFLVDYCGKSMFLLANEIEKLCYYIMSQGRSALCRDDILEVCSAEMEYGAFEFANALLANRRADALSVLSAMKFKQVETVAILSELSRVYCDLLTIKIMLMSGRSSSDISKEMKMNEFKVQIYARAAQNMELDRLKKLIEMCCKTDSEVKLSYSKNYIPLEKFICSI